MKIRYFIFVFALVIAFSTALFFQQEDTPPTITSSPPLIDKPVPPDEKVASPVDHATVDWASIKDRLNYEVQSFTPEEEEAFNDLHVLPLNWVVQKDCRAPDDCDLIWEYPPTAYHTMDMDTLEEQSFDNPLAAIMMGIRLSVEPEVATGLSPNERIDWFFRASALSGKTGPLMRLTGYGIDSSKHDDPKLSIAQQASIEHIAQMLGDERADPQQYIDEIREYWESEYVNEEMHQDTLASSRDQIYHLYAVKVDYMKKVQRAVTGSNQIFNRFWSESDGGSPDA